MTGYRPFTAPVRGGELAAGGGGHGAEPLTPVLAVHGITASHRAWPLVAERLPGTRVIAPDLRGRGGSRGLPGPWGMPQHADDLAALLDAAEVESCLVVGHSMGAFVAVELARRHPDRVTGLVLVDGGLPIPRPEGISDDELAAALIGPAAVRLSMTFPDHAAYRAYWRDHPAFAAEWSPTIEQYIDYDLVGEAPNLHPATRLEAVQQDSLQLDGDLEYAAALAALPIGVDFVRAPRGLLNQVPPLYPDSEMERWRAALPEVEIHEVADVNHYTIVMGERGADAVADLVARRIAETHARSTG